MFATKAGINAATTKVLTTGEKYHTSLSKRFDRTQEGKRIHFASAMTLPGLEDGDNATTGHGHLDIADFILQNCTDVERNLQELYRRVAFNICIGNSYDHFRNHGFLLTAKGWTLSTAYDMNPTLNDHATYRLYTMSLLYKQNPLGQTGMEKIPDGGHLLESTGPGLFSPTNGTVPEEPLPQEELLRRRRKNRQKRKGFGL